jgi:carbon monoxide dehydrogenase subunit G
MAMPIQFEVTETVQATPDHVFDALTDLDEAGQWMAGLTEIETLGEGAAAVGGGWRETRRLFGREATEEFEVTAHDRPRLLGLRVDGSRGSSGRGEYVFTYRLEPRATGTEVRLSGEIRGLTGIAGVVGRLFAGTYRKSCARDLAALKRHVEGVRV